MKCHPNLSFYSSDIECYWGKQTKQEPAWVKEMVEFCFKLTRGKVLYAEGFLIHRCILT